MESICFWNKTAIQEELRACTPAIIHEYLHNKLRLSVCLKNDKLRNKQFTIPRRLFDMTPWRRTLDFVKPDQSLLSAEKKRKTK